MFEVGWSEYLVIFALALIVLGPEKLPKLAASVGRWVGRARTMARQFRDQLEAESESIRTAVHDVQKDFESAATGIETSVSEVKQDIETGLSEPPGGAADSSATTPEPEGHAPAGDAADITAEVEAPAPGSMPGPVAEAPEAGADLEATAEMQVARHETVAATGEVAQIKELDERG